ncbi:hypothetical protein [Saccharopolyspora phatthalungensis]|uniref:Uncharacterized protein n=1 Tax=Saccharopolyspora phatthalungensis TaxID=664693 RepID=A0A840QCS4_9PSEU|nr:hypothetical protein [Saccharopolyspora phatthalungensis]MBB5157590.1 hypothetical protein [Saccharopolyspora phatthalungensis]
MTTLAEPVGRHSLDREPDGYVTAWTGDLNPDLPTRILSLAELRTPAIKEFSKPSNEILETVLDVLLQL